MGPASPMERRNFDEVYSLVYEQLRRLAQGLLRQEYAAQISPSTLVNEAWLKLAGTPQLAETSPLHFRRIAARAMRQVLIDAARRRQAQINGGELVRVTMDTSIVQATGTEKDREVLSLHAALEVLNQRSPRQAQLVEAHFFGGFSFAECAELLGVSEATAMRDWRVARAWLACEVGTSLKARAPVAGAQAQRG